MTECLCNKDPDTTIIRQCVICDRGYPNIPNKIERIGDCPLHKYYVKFLMVGEHEFVCDLCTEKGWYSEVGWGGVTHRLNDTTMQERLKTGEIVYRYHDDGIP